MINYWLIEGDAPATFRESRQSQRPADAMPEAVWEQRRSSCPDGDDDVTAEGAWETDGEGWDGGC